MFTNDLFSSLPTDEYDAKKAYEAYWAIATSESIAVGNFAVGNSTSPIYRFARDLMVRAIMKDYELSISQVAWLYENVLPAGPGWGSLDRMVDYGRSERFGLNRIAQAVANCLGDHGDAEGDFYGHSIDCPFRAES